MIDHGHPVQENLFRALGQTLDDGAGYRAALDLLRQPGRPTALIIGANLYIPGAVRAIRELNIKVPSELSVVGSDENLLSPLIDPPLTIIWRDQRMIGEAAARVLLEQMRAETRPAPRKTMIQSTIIFRASCAAPPD